MTVESTLNHARFEGNGTTGPFQFTFPYFEATDIQVTRYDVLGEDESLVAGTGYILTKNETTDGGSVSLAIALEVGEVLLIERILPLTQITNFRNQGAFFAEIHERAFDRLVMLIQQFQSIVDRIPILPPNLDLGPLVLPPPGAGMWLKWNAAGTDLEAAALPAAFAAANFDYGDSAPVAGVYPKMFFRVNTAAQRGDNFAWVNLTDGGCDFEPFGQISV